MAYKILFTEDALVDLEIILDYVCADNPSAAERFGASLLNYIETTRKLSPNRRHGTQSARRP